MTLADLVAEYGKRRLEAEQHGATAPLAKVYGLVLADLQALDGVATADRFVGTAEAARILNVAPKTVARWAADERFHGARKTSDGGEWLIPLRAVYEDAGRDATARSIPRLWKEEQNV